MRSNVFINICPYALPEPPVRGVVVGRLERVVPCGSLQGFVLPKVSRLGRFLVSIARRASCLGSLKDIAVVDDIEDSSSLCQVG